MELIDTKKFNIEQSRVHIIQWMKSYMENAKLSTWVIGVSGGIDSALVSTLCAETGYPTLCLEMPIHQNKEHVSRAQKHIEWLKKRYSNVQSIELELTTTFDSMVSIFENGTAQLANPMNLETHELALANTRSRLRMTALFYYSNMIGGLVAGTGNKVEDFGVGFYTKGGDGMVDVSPIADLYKTEVREMAQSLGVIEEIIHAVPSDGLWDDTRSDEEQIGASYIELEWAMKYIESNPRGIQYSPEDLEQLTEREQKVLNIYKSRHLANQHKMNPIPVCSVEQFRS